MSLAHSGIRITMNLYTEVSKQKLTESLLSVQSKLLIKIVLQAIKVVASVRTGQAFIIKYLNCRRQETQQICYAMRNIDKTEKRKIQNKTREALTGFPLILVRINRRKNLPIGTIKRNSIRISIISRSIPHLKDHRITAVK